MAERRRVDEPSARSPAARRRASASSAPRRRRPPSRGPGEVAGRTARPAPEAPRFGDRAARRPKGPARRPLPAARRTRRPAVPRPPVAGSRRAAPLDRAAHRRGAPVLARVATTRATTSEAWSSFTSGGPRWRDQQSDWEEADFHDTAALSAETSMGALDQDRTEHSDLFSFDDPVPDRARRRARHRRCGRAAPASGGRSSPRAEAPRAPRGGGGRDVPVAIGVGLGAGVLALVMFKLGPAVGHAARPRQWSRWPRSRRSTCCTVRATSRPACSASPAPSRSCSPPTARARRPSRWSWPDDVITFLWYLLGVVRARPTINVAATLVGFLWVGFLGSFAALMLSACPTPTSASPCCSAP